MQLIKLIQKNKIIIILSLIIVLLFALNIYTFSKKEVKEVKVEVKENTKKIYVDIKGQIKHPGVYEMNVGDRIIDVIKKSGGYKKDHDTSMINLSKEIKDSMVIFVYSKKEVKNLNKKDILDYSCPSINNACLIKDDINDSILVDNNKTTTKIEDKTEEDSIININTASLEQLQTLSGIGEAKAQAIIDYRQQIGKFSDIEEIKNVSGIGDSAYEKIKDTITV